MCCGEKRKVTCFVFKPFPIQLTMYVIKIDTNKNVTVVGRGLVSAKILFRICVGTLTLYEKLDDVHWTPT